MATSSATYLSAFVIGIAVHVKHFHWRNLVSKAAWSGYALKFLFVPLIFGVAAFWLSRTEFLVMILLGAMPPALANTSIAVQLGYDDHFASEFTTLTTGIVLLIAAIVSII